MKYKGTEVSFESVADLRRQYDGAQINTLELIRLSVENYQNNTNKKLVSKIQ